MISFVGLVCDACHDFVFFFFEAVVEGDEIGEVGVVLGYVGKIFFVPEGFFVVDAFPEEVCLDFGL